MQLGCKELLGGWGATVKVLPGRTASVRQAPTEYQGRVRQWRNGRVCVAKGPTADTAQPTSPTLGPAGTAQLTKQLSNGSAIPSRYKMIAATSMAFVLCNMDKINMSVAIIPMAQDFGWSSSIAGAVQASFFWGYLLFQLPGGYLASAKGGQRVLPAGVLLWSVMTCAVPLLASTVPGLCIARAGVGLGEAVAPSAATDLVARTVPPSERSRAVSTIFGGLHVGSILGLLAAPPLIQAFGWQAVFFVFGGMGLAWAAWYPQFLDGLAAEDTGFEAALNRHPSAGHGHEADSAGGGGGHGGPMDLELQVPWRAFMRSGPVRALCLTHLCHNWLHYTMLAWLPTYFIDTLSVDLIHASQTALFPPLAGIAASAAAGPLADGLLAQGLSTPTVRKLLQGAAFLGPCILLCALCTPVVSADRNLTVAAITGALGMSSFSLGGMYCTHQDMSPRYASVLLGVTNTAGAIPGIVGVATVGWLLDATGDWQESLFLPSAGFMLLGLYSYVLHARQEPIDFDEEALSLPFPWEGRVREALPSWVKDRLPW